MCPLCVRVAEDINYIFKDYSKTRDVWSLIWESDSLRFLYSRPIRD